MLTIKDKNRHEVTPINTREFVHLSHICPRTQYEYTHKKKKTTKNEKRKNRLGV